MDVRASGYAIAARLRCLGLREKSDREGNSPFRKMSADVGSFLVIFGKHRVIWNELILIILQDAVVEFVETICRF